MALLILSLLISPLFINLTNAASPTTPPPPPIHIGLSLLSFPDSLTPSPYTSLPSLLGLPSDSLIRRSWTDTLDSITSLSLSAVQKALSDRVDPSTHVPGVPGSPVRTNGEREKLQEWLDCVSGRGRWEWDERGEGFAREGGNRGAWDDRGGVRGLTVHKRSGAYGSCDKRFYKGRQDRGDREKEEGETEWNVRQSLKWRWIPDESCSSLSPRAGLKSPTPLPSRLTLCHYLRSRRVLLLGDQLTYALHDLFLDFTSQEGQTCYGDVYCAIHQICQDDLGPNAENNPERAERAESWERDERDFGRLEEPPALRDKGRRGPFKRAEGEGQGEGEKNETQVKRKREEKLRSTTLRYARSDGLFMSSNPRHPSHASIFVNPHTGVREVNKFALADVRRSDVVIVNKPPLPFPDPEAGGLARAWEKWTGRLVGPAEEEDEDEEDEGKVAVGKKEEEEQEQEEQVDEGAEILLERRSPSSSNHDTPDADADADALLRRRISSLPRGESSVVRLLSLTREMITKVWLKESIDAFLQMRFKAGTLDVVGDQLLVYRSGWRAQPGCGQSLLPDPSPSDSAAFDWNRFWADTATRNGAASGTAAEWVGAGNPGDGPPPRPQEPTLVELLFDLEPGTPHPKDRALTRTEIEQLRLLPIENVFYNLQITLTNHLVRTILAPAFGAVYLDMESTTSVWRSGMVGGAGVSTGEETFGMEMGLGAEGLRQLVLGQRSKLPAPPPDCVRYCWPSPGMAIEETFLGGLQRAMEGLWGGDEREKDWVGAGYTPVGERTGK